VISVEKFVPVSLLVSAMVIYFCFFKCGTPSRLNICAASATVTILTGGLLCFSPVC